MKIDGQCHCGQVSYEAEIDPAKVSICHCTDCQTLTGSAYRVTVAAERDKVKMTGAPPKLYVKLGESGKKRLQYFCPNCGSPVYVTGEGEDAARYGLRWGAIRQRDALKPTRQIWCKSAAPWIGDLDKVPGQPTE